MFTIQALSAALMLPALYLPGASAVPATVEATVQVSSLEGRTTDLGPCQNYHPMSLGKLVFHNQAAIVGQICWRYADQDWPVEPQRLPGSHNSSPPQVVVGSSHEYWWDDHMSTIQRDRAFNLYVCDITSVDPQAQIGENFEIQSQGPLWTADTTVTESDITDYGGADTESSPSCDVQDEVR